MHFAIIVEVDIAMRIGMYDELPFKKQVSAKDYFFSAGTWTPTINGGLVIQTKAAAAETVFVSIPFNIERAANQFGIKVVSFNVVHRATTADIVAITASLYKQNLGNPTVTIPANVTRDNIPVTVSSVLTADPNFRLTTVTVNTPVYENLIGPVPDQNYILAMGYQAAATTVLALGDTTMNYIAVI
jgi:hypothetical protein